MQRFSIVMAVLLITATALGDDVTGSDTLLCSASRIIVCFEEGATIHAAQSHVVRLFDNGRWLALDYSRYHGGESWHQGLFPPR